MEIKPRLAGRTQCLSAEMLLLCGEAAGKSLSFCSKLCQGKGLLSSAFLPGSGLIEIPNYKLAN